MSTKYLIITALLSTLFGCPSTHPQGPGYVVVNEPQDPVGFQKARDHDTRWRLDHLPVTLMVHRNAEAWRSHVSEAVDVWNSRIGCQVLRLDPEPYDGKFRLSEKPLSADRALVPVYLSPPDSKPITSYYANGKGYFTNVSVWLPSGTRHAESMAPICVHELGHVMGLDHDPHDPASIMHPRITRENLGFMRPTSMDVYRLKKAYCPR